MFKLITALLAMLVVEPTLAAVQAYPDKPVQLVVPFPADGVSDIAARQWARVASTYLGQPIVVVHKPGDTGAAGTTYVMNAPADGYTLLVTTVSNQVLRPMATTVPYRYDSFAPIGQVSVAILVLATRSDRPWTSLRDLVEDAKTRPGAITFAATPRLFPHLTVARFEEAAGIALKLAPYDGEAPAIAATLKGQADLLVATMSAVLDHVAAGALRPLATFSRRRDAALGSVRTATEQGFAVVGELWLGIVAPKETPPDILARLRTAFALTVRDPEFVKSMVERGQRVMPLDAERFAARWKQDFDALEPLIKALR